MNANGKFELILAQMREIKRSLEDVEFGLEKFEDLMHKLDLDDEIIEEIVGVDDKLIEEYERLELEVEEIIDRVFN